MQTTAADCCAHSNLLCLIDCCLPYSDDSNRSSKCGLWIRSNKKRAEKNLHPVLDMRGNIANKDEEKAEVLNAFFALDFNGQTGCSQGSQPPVLEDREGVRNKTPIIQEAAVNDLLCHLDADKSVGPDGSTQEC